MTRRLPILPTLLVAAAVAAMIGLGIWQLQRAEWKKGLIARHRAAAKLDPVGWPETPIAPETLLYRRAAGHCVEPLGWRAVAGQNRAGDTGWAHVVTCRTRGGGTMQVDMGWSSSSAQPAGWLGGAVSGVIAPDRMQGIRLVSATPAPGLQPSAPPSPELTPNNHLLYAIQWFFFAAAAAVIYVLALRRRRGR